MNGLCSAASRATMGYRDVKYGKEDFKRIKSRRFLRLILCLVSKYISECNIYVNLPNTMDEYSSFV